MSAAENAVMPTPDAALIEQVVLQGDLSKLSPAQRVQYYRSVCESVGLNPLTKPFEYLNLNGKLVLYAGRNCTDQIRKIHHVDCTISGRETYEDIYVVTARGTLPDGRTDEATGAVNIAGLKGEAKANAYMKAETKAKRRLTLSIVGLGWLDETEVETIPSAQRVTVEPETGEIAPPLDTTPQANPKNLNRKSEPTLSDVTSRLQDLLKQAEEAGFPREDLTRLIEAVCQGRSGHERKKGDGIKINRLLEAMLRCQPPHEASEIIEMVWKTMHGSKKWSGPEYDYVLAMLQKTAEGAAAARGKEVPE